MEDKEEGAGNLANQRKCLLSLLSPHGKQSIMQNLEALDNQDFKINL